jgi:hypothetical protein
VGCLAGAVGADLDEGPGLVATLTLLFLFAVIGGPAAVLRRLGDACAGVAAGHRRLIRAGLAEHGG